MKRCRFATPNNHALFANAQSLIATNSAVVKSSARALGSTPIVDQPSGVTQADRLLRSILRRLAKAWVTMSANAFSSLGLSHLSASGVRRTMDESTAGTGLNAVVGTSEHQSLHFRFCACQSASKRFLGHLVCALSTRVSAA